MVFCGTFECTGKGYVERELLLLRLKERGVLIQDSLCSPLKSGGFLARLCAPVRGMWKGNFSRFALERGGYLFRARFACLSKVVVFCGTFGCTGKGYIERGTIFQGLLCSHLKSGGFLWHFWVRQ